MGSVDVLREITPLSPEDCFLVMQRPKRSFSYPLHVHPEFELNVFENVELPLTYLKVKAGERKQMVNDILKRMNISHRAGHFPQQLSGGQQQRVAIARAVVSNPKIILADEPTGNLDSKNGAEVMQLLTELNREGTTIVMVTHSKHDASFAHRIINLFDGSIVSSVNEFI